MIRLLRWLYGRSALNRIDTTVLPVLFVVGWVNSFPWWLWIVLVMWAVISVLTENAIFGQDYQKRIRDAIKRAEQ